VFEPNQRVKDVQRVAVEAPMYLVELLVSFKGVKRVVRRALQGEPGRCA